jgi:hypothetical protein
MGYGHVETGGIIVYFERPVRIDHPSDLYMYFYLRKRFALVTFSVQIVGT